ncbi:MAG: hypothetical protein MUC48_05845 [Leptolyngbya sp. Prado105]|nr:hypothetical protein [Leptolyngbya sp. Prado105]
MSEAELQQGINEMSLFFAQCQPQDWKELLTFEQNVFETIQQRLQGEDVEFPTVSASIRGLDEEETLITGLDPGEWNPPGNQPIRFYIGAEAHKGISRYYTVAHVGESVFTNFISISTILAEFKNRGFQVKFDRVTPTELGLQPDILNVSSREIYEIKSYRQESTALPQAKKYVGIFKKAGVNIKFGKKDDPGTYGMISAPGGYYIFGAPKDGVIIYRCPTLTSSNWALLTFNKSKLACVIGIILL